MNTYSIKKLFSVGMFILCFAGVQYADAAVTVTPATGGGSVSADKAVNSTGGGVFTALGDIVITEVLTSDFAPFQTNVTLILTAPTNWEFRPGVGAVTHTAIRDITASSLSVASGTITVTFSTDSSSDAFDIITISGIEVVALDGAISGGSDSIVRNSGAVAGGTATITGISNTTNFGVLGQVAGTVTGLAPVTPSTTFTYGDAVPDFYARTVDQFNTPTTVGLEVSRTVTVSTATGTLSGTLAKDIGTGAGAGTATFSGVTIAGAGVAGTNRFFSFSSPVLTATQTLPFIINPKTLTPSATSSDKAYDGTTSAVASVTLATPVGSDDVSASYSSAVFDDAIVGSGKLVTVTGLTLGGTTATNYLLSTTTATTTAAITAVSPTPTPTPTPSSSGQSIGTTKEGRLNNLLQMGNLDYAKQLLGEMISELKLKLASLFIHDDGVVGLQSVAQGNVAVCTPVNIRERTGLQKYDRGDEVKAMQQYLIDHKYDIPSGSTGNFLHETCAALVSFQKNNNISADGFFGEETKRIMYAE